MNKQEATVPFRATSEGEFDSISGSIKGFADIYKPQQALAGVAQWIERGPRPKGLLLEPQSGHTPGLQARSPVGGT